MTVPADALAAAAEACPFVNRDALLRALDAAAPHIAAAAWRDGYGQGRDDEAGDLPFATGEADFTGTAHTATESEGLRVYKAGMAAGRAEGAAAERERIIDLAEMENAVYDVIYCDGGRQFADLIRKTTP